MIEYEFCEELHITERAFGEVVIEKVEVVLHEVYGRFYAEFEIVNVEYKAEQIVVDDYVGDVNKFYKQVGKEYRKCWFCL